jgi:hypothetical protein
MFPVSAGSSETKTVTWTPTLQVILLFSGYGVGLRVEKCHFCVGTRNCSLWSEMTNFDLFLSPFFNKFNYTLQYLLCFDLIRSQITSGIME